MVPRVVTVMAQIVAQLDEEADTWNVLDPALHAYSVLEARLAWVVTPPQFENERLLPDAVRYTGFREIKVPMPVAVSVLVVIPVTGKAPVPGAAPVPAGQ